MVGLRGLVQQAHRELAPAAPAEGQPGQAADAAGMEAADGGFGGAYFDLSLASPALVEAAARGLALLKQ